MKKIYLCLILFSLIFVGCGTKREYFEPKEVAGDIIYTGTLPAPISSLSRYGATLQNGQIITQDGLSSITLDKGFTLIGKFGNKIICTNSSGVLRVLNQDGTKLYEKTFPQAVASASISDDVLAVVDSSNTLYLLRISNGEIYFTNSQDKAYALDARMAAPFFLNSLVIFPTLDGKIVIVDWQTGTFVRDVVVSSERFFNNIIYLNVIKSRLIAATAKRAISISPSKTSFLDENIKDIITIDDDIVVLSEDGRIITYDFTFKAKKEHKFLFAVFVGAMSDGTLYVAERNGHLIRSDVNLENIKIYNLPDKVDELLFMSNDTIYYDKYITKLYEK